MGKVINISHMGIVVEDLEKMKKFFTEILGFSVKKEYRCNDESTRRVTGLNDADISIAELAYSNDGPTMRLLNYHNPKSNNHMRSKDFMIHDIGVHYSLEVRGIEEIYEKLEAAGLYCIHAPVWHASGSAFLFCRDYEGNFCEMIQIGK